MHTTAARTLIVAALLAPGAGAQTGAKNPAKLPFQILDGAVTSGFLGQALASAGDVNADGVADLIVGSPGGAIPGAVIVGSARVLSGLDLSELRVFQGAAVPDLFGRAVAGVGDANGDRFADVAVLASGYASVLSGADGAELLRLTALGYFGSPEPPSAVAGGGDVNGDGHDDVVVGYRYRRFPDTQGVPGAIAVERGLVQVYSGVDGAPLHRIEAPDLKVGGVNPSPMYLGQSVALLDDVNGDGLADFAAGAPADNTAGYYAGSVRVFSGADGSELYSVSTPNNGAGSLGWTLAATGDLDGDGVGDLLAGAPWETVNLLSRGAVRAVSGASGKVIHVLDGAQAGGEFGRALAGGGDVDGDGVDDILVGGIDLARLVSGATGALLVKYNQGADDFGAALALVVDLNGDRRVDPVVGVPRADPVVQDEGQLQVFLGACDLVDSYCTAGVSAGGCAGALSSSGKPSASKGSGFVVTASGVDGATRGVFVFGVNGRRAHPFGSGGSLICLEGPVFRTAALVGGGSPGACDGTLSADLNGIWNGTRSDSLLGAGARVQVQAAFRDALTREPVLSSALELTVCP